MREFNVVVLGAGGVGKSALTVRFVRNEFVEHYDPTIEEEYRRTIEFNGVVSHLEVIDTAGAEQFTSINEVIFLLPFVSALLKHHSGIHQVRSWLSASFQLDARSKFARGR